MFDSLFAQGGLSLDRLKILIEVHDAGSIAQAAPRDPARQSQFSRQLRELSEFFGCEVAKRQGKFLKLTLEGIRIAEMAREFLRNVDDFHTECRNERFVFKVAAGDSLLQWLVIPQMGRILHKQAQARFSTVNLRTLDIMNQVADSRVDFGLVRRSALGTGMDSAPLGTLSYVAVVPKRLVQKKKAATLTNFFTDYPIAMQTTEGEFTNRLRAMAVSAGADLQPALACQSFPQVFAAVKSELFAAVLPEIAVRELSANTFTIISAKHLRDLEREIILIWNQRVIEIRPSARRILAQLEEIFQLGSCPGQFEKPEKATTGQ